MNRSERQMMEILVRGKEKYGVLGVKAEFEAEGTRNDELLRLIEIARKAGVNIGLKIGGCEAVRDLLEARQIGVDYIIAPMVESPYAVSKYIDAKNKVYTPDEQEDVKFLFNMETQLAFTQLDEIIAMAKSHQGGADGVVFGRVDYTLSRGMGRDDINQEVIVESIMKTSDACKANGLELVVGGGVALEALESLRRVRMNYLDRFETRKIIFSADILSSKDVELGLKDAVQFELLWLTNKRDYYAQIQQEDAKRIGMLDARLKELNALYSKLEAKVA